ncbi:HGxxPAAW family protein [uncultured Pseudokineococcus sp.]|uniref:HGxxPAAW family protein n=1 Tax=uncultured Pseudokineococcus sp. TaxID=1642928 RepID=UPI00260601CF|nr:HGxxPAAW family protein [uncultured Pseudokineococcus sp.]
MAERTQSREQDRGQQPAHQHQPQLPPHAEDHGHSLAAWAGVGICILGALIASLAVVFTIWWMLAAGFLVAFTGPVVGKVLAMKGHGAGTPKQSSDRPGDDTHDSQAGAGRSAEGRTDTAHGPR